MFYYIYKIWYPETGQFYLGRHCSETEFDHKYWGSGWWVRWARCKGLNLNKKVLCYADNFEDLCELELHVIKEVINDPLCVNIHIEHWDINGHFIGWYHTPYGVFTSKRAAALAAGIAHSTLDQRCKKCDVPIKHNRFTPRDYIGKTWRELGWYFEYKESI